MIAAVVPLFGAIWPITWSLGDILVAIIVIAACIAIVVIAVHKFGIVIPPWAVQMFWVVVVAVAASIAIRILLSL